MRLGLGNTLLHQGRAERINTTLENSDQAGDIWTTVNKRELGNHRDSKENLLNPVRLSLAH